MCFPDCCSWPRQPIPDCPAPTGAEWPGAEPGWLLPPPGLSAAPLLPTWQGSAPAVAAGRAQAALSCCPLHKGTILGAPSHPHRGTSSPASSSPVGRNLLGNENGNRNCPGSSAKCSGGRGLPQRAAVLGLEGAASISLGNTPLAMPVLGHPAGHGDTSQRCVALAGGSTSACGELSTVCVLQRTPLGPSVPQAPPCRAPPGAGVPPGAVPTSVGHPGSSEGLFAAGGSWKEPCAGRQSVQGPCPCQQEGFICAWVLF